jgi:hypothetical protein
MLFCAHRLLSHQHPTQFPSIVARRYFVVFKPSSASIMVEEQIVVAVTGGGVRSCNHVIAHGCPDINTLELAVFHEQPMG